MPSKIEVVTAAEIIRNFGYWQQQALVRPITITHHGRARVLLVAVEEYERLRGGHEHVQALDEGGALKSSVQLRAILENMAEGYILFDSTLKVVSINKVAAAFYGVDHETALGEGASSLSLGESTSFVTQWVRRVQRTGEIASFDVVSSGAVGRFLSVRAFPILDHVAVLFVNISEQERLQEESAEWAACRAAMTLHSGVSLAKLDARGRIASADEPFQRLTGFTAAELERVKLFDIVAPTSRKRLQTMFDDVVTQRRAAEISVEIMSKTGPERMMHLSFAPLSRDLTSSAALMLMTASPAEDAGPGSSRA